MDRGSVPVDAQRCYLSHNGHPTSYTWGPQWGGLHPPHPRVFMESTPGISLSRRGRDRRLTCSALMAITVCSHTVT
jgi:hypothetical protein